MVENIISCQSLLSMAIYLEVVDKFKLLGIHIRSDMKWYDNTDKGMEDYES